MMIEDELLRKNSVLMHKKEKKNVLIYNYSSTYDIYTNLGFHLVMHVGTVTITNIYFFSLKLIQNMTPTCITAWAKEY